MEIGDPKIPIINKSIKEIIGKGSFSLVCKLILKIGIRMTKTCCFSAGTDNFPPGWEKTYDRQNSFSQYLILYNFINIFLLFLLSGKECVVHSLHVELPIY